MSKEMVGWAVERFDGSVVVLIGSKVTQTDIWRKSLGWVSKAAIERHKSQGARAFRCKLIQIEDQDETQSNTRRRARPAQAGGQQG